MLPTDAEGVATVSDAPLASQYAARAIKVLATAIGDVPPATRRLTRTHLPPPTAHGRREVLGRRRVGGARALSGKGSATTAILFRERTPREVRRRRGSGKSLQKVRVPSLRNARSHGRRSSALFVARGSRDTWIADCSDGQHDQKRARERGRAPSPARRNQAQVGCARSQAARRSTARRPLSRGVGVMPDHRRSRPATTRGAVRGRELIWIGCLQLLRASAA